MTTARTALGGLLALALASASWPGDAAAHTCDDPFSTNLIAGQTIDAGDVEVCNDDATLTVTYEATVPWCLLKTDLHVATSKSGIPRNKPGNPIPGHFDYGDEHDCAGTASFEIPLDEIDGGVGPSDTVVIAAHAEVEDDTGREEGAWGEDPRFVERGNWAMYFTYDVQEEETCNTPGGSCTVFVTRTTHTGNLGGLDGADAICQALAESLTSMAPPGTYKAWLSTSAASAAARLTHATIPYRLVDGTTIADDWDDLTDGDLQAPINRNADGSLGTVRLVWTGTAADGSFQGSDCAAWSSESMDDVGVTGSTGATDFQWTLEAIQLQCNPQFPLYCF